MNSLEIIKLIFVILIFLPLVIMTRSTRCGILQHRRSQRPFAEAIAANEGRQTGKNVQFTGRNSTFIEASYPVFNGQWVAVPEKMPHEVKRPQ